MGVAQDVTRMSPCLHLMRRCRTSTNKLILLSALICHGSQVRGWRGSACDGPCFCSRLVVPIPRDPLPHACCLLYAQYSAGARLWHFPRCTLFPTCGHRSTRAPSPVIAAGRQRRVLIPIPKWSSQRFARSLPLNEQMNEPRPSNST